MTKNVNLPILQNVLMKVDGGTIRFTATNLEIAVNCTVRGKVDEPGEYTIPSKLFFDYVSLLPNETIHLEADQEHLRIACGNHKTKIHGLSATEFPLVPIVDGDRTFQIPIEALKRALSQVLFSVASNESRPELTGVCMRFYQFEGEGRLRLASTDSYRLSEVTIPLQDQSIQDHQLVMPSKTLTELSRILSVFKDQVDLPSTVTLQLSQSQAVFTYGPVELISRVIDESYPDYEQIIPTVFQTRAVIDRDDFMKAVKAASLFSKNGLFDITLQFSPQEGQLSVQSTDAQRGQNQSACQAEIQGSANSVSVNYRYLLDGLQAMSDEQIVFEMIDAANPCLLTPKSSVEGYRYILMPIRQ